MKRKEKALLAAVILLAALSYLLPAISNGHPKGSDTYYHMRIADLMAGGCFPVLYDPLNAGGTPNPYPPLFHVFMTGVFLLSEPMTAATFIGPLLFVISAAAFYLFSTGFLGREKGIVATFVYGISLNIIWWSGFSAPFNLALPMMLLSLHFTSRYLKEGRETMLMASTVLAFLVAVTHTLTAIMLLLAFLVLYYKHIRKAYPPLLSVLALALWLFFAGAPASLMPAYDFGLPGFISAFQWPFILLVIAGLMVSERRMIAWYAILVAFIFLVPMYPERVMTFSIIPASMIASNGFFRLWNHSRKLLMVLGMLLLFLSLPVFYNLEFTRAEIREQDIRALEWIRANIGEDAVVASPWQTSAAWMPAIAEKANVLGNLQEAVPDYMQRRSALYMLFNETDPSGVEAYGADYVFINQWEDNVLYPGAIERLGASMEAVYENGYAHVYKI